MTQSAITGLNIHYGAGWVAPTGWMNFDASPSLWLERLPGIGRLIRVNAERFPDSVAFGNIVTGLNVPKCSAKAIYASHVLEHLSFKDCRRALRNTYDLLKPGGVFRLVVPDLKARAERYLSSNGSDAAHRFMRETLLGKEMRPRTCAGRIRSMLGNSDHLWMWDEASMTDALTDAGFVGVRRCSFGDGADESFRDVESRGRFFDDETGIEELAIEAAKQ